MFVSLPAEVITQVVSTIHEEYAKFFYAEYFKEPLEEKDSPLAVLHGIQECLNHNSEPMCSSHERSFEIGN